MEGKWIWLSDGIVTENERGMFRHIFSVEETEETYEIHITALTRYILIINGMEIGRGPIRSKKGEVYYDTYDISSLLVKGQNEFLVRVWNYGWSTYQSIASKGGLYYEIRKNGCVSICSGEETMCRREHGHKYNTVKRNVNLGFMDYYDARVKEQDYLPASIQETNTKIVGERPIKSYHTKSEYPNRIISIQEVKKGCQQVSINTRQAFFGKNRVDADESIFSGFLGCVIQSPEEMEGKICFPNRTWNGLLGDFTIDGKNYIVTNEDREVPVLLKKGKQLFLLQLSGKYDDLYCHLEFCFEHKIEFCGIKEKDVENFFVIGPTGICTQTLDGVSRVYGGLEEYNKLEVHTQEHEGYFACQSIKEIEKLPYRYVEKEYVFYEEYLYSIVRQEKIVSELPILKEYLGLLWGNRECTVINPPCFGESTRMIVDFAELYVGALQFTLWAKKGTILDIYCFENMFHEEIDYTVGLNNSVRYICREGWQSYTCFSRMGCRYAMLEIRNQKETFKIQEFKILFSTYAPSNRGSFVCSDALLNKIWEISKQTHLLCMEDSFTDCPTWEQSFWIGDAQISALVNAYLYGEYDLIRHNLILAATASENTPLLNALTPTDWNTSIPMWMMNWVVSISQYIKVSGDSEILKVLYSPVKNTLLYYGKLIQEDGAFLIHAWNMLDWAPMDIHNYGVVTGQQSLLAYCYQLASDYAVQTGHVEDCIIYREYRTRLLQYIDTKLWDDEQKMFIDGWSPEHGMSSTVSMQTHILLCLFGGIIDREKEKRAQELLEHTPKCVLEVGSPFFLFYLYEVWAEQGKLQLILEDMKKRFGKMLYYDSTTCWEVFPGFYENSRTRSYCHGWSAAPVYFLSKYVLGICNDSNGFKAIHCEAADVDLSWWRGSIPTPHGDLKVIVEKEGEDPYYQITYPVAVCVEGLRTEGFEFKEHKIGEETINCIP